MDRAALVSEIALPEPPSSNRWWRMVVIKGQPRMLLSAQARRYKTDVVKLAFALGYRSPAYDGPVHVAIDWYRGRKSGDLDKRLGIVLDSLQGVLFENDSQIVELRARRFDSPNRARVIVTVTPVGAVQESLLVGTALDPSTP